MNEQEYSGHAQTAYDAKITELINQFSDAYANRDDSLLLNLEAEFIGTLYAHLTMARLLSLPLDVIVSASQEGADRIKNALINQDAD
jgi:DNA-binding GntR family transcriptional regulator